MGCVPSSQHSEGPAASTAVAAAPATVTSNEALPQKVNTEAESVTKSKSTRARRMSYISSTDKGPTGDLTIKAEPPTGPGTPSSTSGSPGPVQTVAQSTKTRARRLSYVTNDPNAVQGAMALPPNTADFGEQPETEPSSAYDETAPEDCEKKLKVQVACMSRAGREPGFKKTNQDNCFAFEKYMTNDQSLFGTMDGHGPQGHLVSGYVKQHLPIVLVNLLSSEADPCKALSLGFNKVHKSLGKSRIDCEFSGSTAVVAYLKGTTLTTSWVGDSRGVIARHGPKGTVIAADLTNDHKPTLPEEKERIIKCNGRVERLVDEDGQPMGPDRVWLQYAWIPGLAMSRAIGDMLAQQVGVTADPEQTVNEITENDKFFILASDGVWEFVSSQEAVDIVNKYESVEEGCRQLVDEAYQRWLLEEEGVVDDITAVVVRFLHN